MYFGHRSMTIFGRAWALVVTILAAFPLAAQPAAVAARVDYTVEVVGVEDSGLKDSIVAASQLLEDSRRPVPSIRALRRRVETVLPRISALLRARGYYAATQDFDIERKSETIAVVSIKIDPGPLYRIERYEILPTTPGEPRRSLDVPFATLGLAPGDIARSEIVAAADANLLAALGRQAYPLARIGDRKIVVDHETRTMSVRISVATGPAVRFGETRTEGLSAVRPGLIARHVAWVRGVPFDSAALEKTRKKLRQTGLFSSVIVRHAEKEDRQGELDVTISVIERAHRSIGAGGSFSTTEGPLGKLFWEHRNLWGHGERLRIRGEVGSIRQGVFGDLRLSDVGSLDQDIVLDTRATKEQPDGFTSVETVATLRLERRFSEIYAGSAGIGFDRSNVEENDTDRNFTFLTLPLSARRDTSDDLLDPGRGGRDTLTLTPNIGILGTDSTFVAARLFDTVYLPLMAKKKLVVAGWARIGTILGERTLGIPANKRLYSGGSGSVRGYALNSIGPLDAQNDPVGGRSSTEFGAELRWRVSGPFGLVAFAEAGGVYDDRIPDWGQDLQWGAGLGARYLTAIGPIRLDVAIPINRRNAVDDAFQILVSLGQAF